MRRVEKDPEGGWIARDPYGAIIPDADFRWNCRSSAWHAAVEYDDAYVSGGRLRKVSRRQSPPKRPIIFLDCDGVVNNDMTLKLHQPPRGGYISRTHLHDPLLVERLRRLIETTQASVVVISTWRKTTTRRRFVSLLSDGWLNRYIMRGRLWRTNPDPSPFRGDDVQTWFASNRKYAGSAYVILDDGKDFHPDQHHVCTDASIGLTDADVDAAIRLLRQQRH